jgi:hypothetical protein
MLKFSLRPTTNRKLVRDTGSTFGRYIRRAWFATYREVGASCPDCDAFKFCYAKVGRTAIHQRGAISDNDGAVFANALQRVPAGSVVRIHVSGDVWRDGDGQGAGSLDVAYLQAIVDACAARPDVIVFGYTHAWKSIPRDMLSAAPNLTINASCDTLADVATARAAGWDTVTVGPADIAWKRRDDMVVCPYERDGMRCSECGLCVTGNRRYTVVFPVHSQLSKNYSTGDPDVFALPAG